MRSILIQICSSLEEAHERGVIHRDLKPSNVMICQLALNHDFVKVLDFGLAKCAACEDLGAALTVEGTTAGTPGYIAPEVALGELNVDARADIYALGCVAYFLLTGTLVFPDSNPMSMALKHVQATPDLPSSRTELPIPAELEALVMRCLAKRPDDRPSSVREIADTLSAQKFAVWIEHDAAEWWRRHLPRSSSLRAAWDETGTVQSGLEGFERCGSDAHPQITLRRSSDCPYHRQQVLDLRAVVEAPETIGEHEPAVAIDDEVPAHLRLVRRTPQPFFAPKQRASHFQVQSRPHEGFEVDGAQTPAPVGGSRLVEEEGERQVQRVHHLRHHQLGVVMRDEHDFRSGLGNPLAGLDETNDVGPAEGAVGGAEERQNDVPAPHLGERPGLAGSGRQLQRRGGRPQTAWLHGLSSL